MLNKFNNGIYDSLIRNPEILIKIKHVFILHFEHLPTFNQLNLNNTYDVSNDQDMHYYILLIIL